VEQQPGKRAVGVGWACLFLDVLIFIEEWGMLIFVEE